MTSREQEEALLLGCVEDATAGPKLVLADWYEEHGAVVMAAGLRWMARHGRHPKFEEAYDGVQVEWSWHEGWRAEDGEESFQLARPLIDRIREMGFWLGKSKTDAEAFRDAASVLSAALTSLREYVR